ncbi:XdhC family protein [uncultured Marinobacter sp.]|uniref:XdhC family protein n=1 Tax=uncultured Marinobacter sp. TaxID=187379 RepID=UPI0030D7A807
MQQLDLQVIEQALKWSDEGQDVWLCTVLATFGSSPREPGSWLVATADGRHAGSLSGGCVEEDFLARLRDGVFSEPVSQLRYGEPDGPDGPRVRLPCGGLLDVLIERLSPGQPTRDHLVQLQQALTGHQPLLRRVSLDGTAAELHSDNGLGPRVESGPKGYWKLRVGPAARLIIAGISPVSEACAQFAQALGFEVIVCDPREEVLTDFSLPGITVKPILPSQYIADGHCHEATAIVALTHDPRIDDLAMMEAVRTGAFYIGVMGSMKTSRARAERLQRIGGLDEQQIARIHMPIGLNLGSKTPAEIALAVMADIVRVRKGTPRHEV